MELDERVVVEEVEALARAEHERRDDLAAVERLRLAVMTPLSNSSTTPSENISVWIPR